MTIELIHGDALDVLAGLPDASVDMVFTDPPYGHNNNNGDLIARWEAALGRGDYVAERDDRPIANDGPEANTLFRAALPQVRRLLSPGCCCCCCCCGGGGPDPQFARWSMWLDEAIGFKQMVVWDKGGLGMGWHYRRNYETVLVGMVPGAACRCGARSIDNASSVGGIGARSPVLGLGDSGVHLCAGRCEPGLVLPELLQCTGQPDGGGDHPLGAADGYAGYDGEG